MQSAQHALKQVLAMVVAVSLVISIAPPPLRAEAQPSHAGLPLSNLPSLATSQAQRRLSTNSASLSISPRLGTSTDVKGFNTPETLKKSVALTDMSDRQKPRTARRPTQAIERFKANAVRRMPGSRPLAFIENKGQFNDRVKFQVQGNGHTLWLTDSGIVFDSISTQIEGQLSKEQPNKFDPKKLGVGDPRIEKPAPRDMVRHVIYQDFLGTNHEVAIETKGVQLGAYNYLTGSDSTKWQTQVRGFQEVIYRDVWKGVDLRMYGKGPDIEQEFIVRPGANLDKVHVAYKGIDALEVAKDGSLRIRTAVGEMRESVPHIYQEIAGRHVVIEGHFKLLSKSSYTFEVAPHDAQYTLVVDPTLLYSTFLGGSAGNSLANGNNEVANGIAVDSSGSAYVAGNTFSQDFPTTPGAFQVSPPSGTFITKLNATGTALVYSTYLGQNSGITAIAVDTIGQAYVTGYTGFTSGFPTTPNAYWPTNSSQTCINDFFVAKLNAAGNQLLYSSCFNGSLGLGIVYGYRPNAIAVDSVGKAYITGRAGNSVLIPTTPNAYESAYARMPDSAFVTVFDTTASGTASLYYSTYLGVPTAQNNPIAWGNTRVSPDSYASGIAVDSFGKIYITGNTWNGFPTTPGGFQVSHGAQSRFNGIPYTDAFVAKLDPSAPGSQSLIYSTYLGGEGADYGNAIAVDPSGNAYVTGYTWVSLNTFPVTPGAFQTTSGGLCAFVSKIDASGSRLLYSTYVTGSDGYNSAGSGIAVDSLGDAYVTGYTNSSTFPLTPDAFQSTYLKPVCRNDCSSAFVTKINPAGSALIYSSYLGGQGDDAGTGIAVDQAGDAYITGHTSSGNFPIILGAFQPGMDGTGDAFVTKFPLGAAQALSISSVTPSSGGNAGTVTGRILGAGFHIGASVVLTGATAITGTSSVGSEGRTIEVTFDLTGTPAGSYGLTVVNPDGTSTTLADAFFVEQGGVPQLGISVVIPRTFAINRGPTVFNVQVRNTGNVDADGVVLALYGIPADAILKTLFDISPIPARLGGQNIDFTGVPFAPTVGQQQIPTLLLSRIPAGSAIALNFSLAFTALPLVPPLMPPPPIPRSATTSNLRITAVGVPLSSLCKNKALGCIEGILTESRII